MKEVARGNIETKMGSIIKTYGPNGETEYKYDSENGIKYAFLFRTYSELNSIKDTFIVAENTFKSKQSNPEIAYFLWTGAVVSLCSLFDGQYLKHNRIVLDNANIEMAWKCLKEHRNSDLTHNTNKQDYPKFAYFLDNNEDLELENRIKISPKYSRNSYPPFTDSYEIVSNLMSRLIYCCKEEIDLLKTVLKKELVEIGKDELLNQPEFEIVVRKNSWSKAITKYKTE